jgi:LCP family protein required for cell wall assembly
VLQILVQPRWLWVILLANLLVGIARLASIADAWWPLRSPVAPAGWAMRGLVVVVTLLVLLPHLVVHVYTTEALALFDQVFVGGQVASAAEREAALLAEGRQEEDLGPTITTTTSTSTTSTTRPGPIDPASLVVPGTDPIPEVGPLGRRYTVLLAGGDFGPGRKDLRTDVMIVASLDMSSGTASLIGISRELANAPLPTVWADSTTMRSVQTWHEDQAYAQIVAAAQAQGVEPAPQEREPYCFCFYDRINYLHVLTADWVRTFPDAPDPGMEALRQTLELLLGIPIDAYVLVDFAGFVDLVDALGGVRVTVDRSLDNGFSPAREGEDPVWIDVDPGVHVLNGHEALAYVRDRSGTSDSERMRRQRCMIRELAGSASANALLREFPAIARAIRTSTTTTLPLELLPAIIEALSDLDEGDIATLAISSPTFTDGQNYMRLPLVVPSRVQAAVSDLFAGVAGGTTLGQADECPQ